MLSCSTTSLIARSRPTLGGRFQLERQSFQKAAHKSPSNIFSEFALLRCLIFFNLIRHITTSYKQTQFEDAKAKILEALQDQIEFVHREMSDRSSHIHDVKALDIVTSMETGELRAGVDEDIVVVSVTTREKDISLYRLNDIRHACLGSPKRITIQLAAQIPKYEAWVPVLQNHYVEDTDIEPYHPYFGESQRDKDLARDVFELMIMDRDQGPFDEPSDGEIRENGRLFPPHSAEEVEIFHGLESTRDRAAQRHSILLMKRRHGQVAGVWVSLAEAFKIFDVRRLRYLGDLSERRENETKKRAARIQKSRGYADDIRKAPRSTRSKIPSTRGKTFSPESGPLKAFCFACHRFACHLHEGENVVPVLPIPDRAMDKRMTAIHGSDRALPPCSECCFLCNGESRCSAGTREGEPWNEEQVQILRQAVLMFGEDPCSLSTVLGEKTCREVYGALSRADEVAAIADLRVLYGGNSVVRRSLLSSSDDDEHKISRIKKRGRRRRRENVAAKKSAPAMAEYGSQRSSEVRKRFIPCNHPGTCSKKNSCICAVNQLNCESQCGCNCGRYVEGRKGMKWEPPSEENVGAGFAGRCRLRYWGCKCTSGHCNTSRCECYVDLRACNPDNCRCDCCVLPSKISVRRRQCRSSDTITSMHKRTLIGRSAVHGYGLFAGEFFAIGDLVGQYCGRVMSPELADKSLRSSQARKQTYAFELTDSLTVDGGSIGSKVKFINHSQEEDKINCGARIESVRGDGRIVLRATRAVYPGEEFLFNYNILDDEGNDWMIQKVTEEADEDNDSGSDVDWSGQNSVEDDPRALYDDQVSGCLVKEEDEEALP